MSDFDYHIYRVTHATKDMVVIAKAEAGVDPYYSQVIASFKTKDLRDIAFEAFIIHIKMNRKRYPNHVLPSDA